MSNRSVGPSKNVSASLGNDGRVAQFVPKSQVPNKISLRRNEHGELFDDDREPERYHRSGW